MKVIWNLTRVCRWNCSICCVSAIYVGKSATENEIRKIIGDNELNLTDKLKIVDELFRCGVQSIDFSGGDLLLLEENIEVIKYASFKFGRENISISIPDIICDFSSLAILQEVVSKFEFTLDTLDEDTDGSRPKGYVECAKHAIRYCREKNIDVCISTVLKKSNCTIKNILDIYNFLRDVDVREWEILKYYRVGRAIDFYGLIPGDQQLQDVISTIKILMNKKAMDISFQHSLENYINKSIRCNALTRSVGILPDGTVITCSWGLGYGCKPIDNKFVIGKLPDKQFSEILVSDKAKEWLNGSFCNGKMICQVESMNTK